MSELKDLQNMIEVLQLAIVRQETEEQFFRRSAKHSTNNASQALFTEVADELIAYIKSLDARRQKLVDTLNNIKKG